MIDTESDFAPIDDVLNELESIAGINDNIDERIASRDRMERSYRMGLATIREVAALTQTEVAERMGIGQTAVSRIENRDDWLLSTMKAYFDAIGAEASINIRLAGVEHNIALSKLIQSN